MVTFIPAEELQHVIQTGLQTVAKQIKETLRFQHVVRIEKQLVQQVVELQMPEQFTGITMTTEDMFQIVITEGVIKPGQTITGQKT